MISEARSLSSPALDTQNGDDSRSPMSASRMNGELNPNSGERSTSTGSSNDANSSPKVGCNSEEAKREDGQQGTPATYASLVSMDEGEKYCNTSPALILMEQNMLKLRWRTFKASWKFGKMSWFAVCSYFPLSVNHQLSSGCTWRDHCQPPCIGKQAQNKDDQPCQKSWRKRSSSTEMKNLNYHEIRKNNVLAFSSLKGPELIITETSYSLVFEIPVIVEARQVISAEEILRRYSRDTL
ncbi:hypothetical protein Cgig2_016155 [Carnegiea gigantea]|uniref:Uncharacterized protein n=1 Tax=Carnegiea gigantea TaxID=171969 RepID=A0A9Q1KPR8_9CARY|nr:hypothetical protein Cgig2_016155 [Carnegiea gigantea]